MGDLWDAYRQSLGSEKKQDVRRKVAPEGLSRINQDTRLLGECPSCKALNRITIDSTMTQPFLRYLEFKDDDNQPICRECYTALRGFNPEINKEIITSEFTPYAGMPGHTVCPSCRQNVPLTNKSFNGDNICRDCFANTDGVLPEALSKKDFIQMKALKLLDKLQRNKE